MIELVVVVAVIGIIAAIGVPVFLTFWQTSALKGGAEELAAIVNNGRLLAIKENQSACVERITGNLVRYRVGGCGGTIWTGPGTGTDGSIRLANDIGVTGATTVAFSYLGAATTAGTFTVQRCPPPGCTGPTLSVVVATTGRVTIGP